MNRKSALAALAAGFFLLQACDQGPRVEEEAAIAPVAQPNVVEIRAVGMTFEGSSEIPSGWTTFRFVNASSMIHFALIDVLPKGVTAQNFTDTAGQYFQDAMDAMNAGAWLDWRAKEGLEDPSPATFLGGINDMPEGSHSYFTVDLQPGNYAFIAEVPRPQELGLVLPLTVEAAN